MIWKNAFCFGSLENHSVCAQSRHDHRACIHRRVCGPICCFATILFLFLLRAFASSFIFDHRCCFSLFLLFILLYFIYSTRQSCRRFSLPSCGRTNWVFVCVCMWLAVYGIESLFSHFFFLCVALLTFPCCLFSLPKCSTYSRLCSSAQRL